MPKCTDETVEFGRVGRRVVEAAFDGGDIVSDGGVLLLKQVDERLGLSRGPRLPSVTNAAALAFSTACTGCWRSASTACVWAGQTCATTTCYATIW